VHTLGKGGSAARSAAFRYLWMGRFVSLVGTGAAAVALQLVVVDAAGATAVAGVFLALSVPQIAGSLIARLIHRRDACRLMIGMDLIQAFLVGLLALTLATGALLYLVLVLVGVASTVFTIAGRTLLRELLAEEQVGSGIAWLAFAGNAQNSLGPVLAAILLAVATPQTALAVNSLTFLLSAASLVAARRATSAGTALTAGSGAGAGRSEMTQSPPRLVGTVQGLTRDDAATAGEAALRLAFSSGALGAFAGAILNVALVVRLRQDLDLPGQQYGAVLAAFGVGTVLASPAYQQLPRVSAVARLRLALAGVGACCLLVASLADPLSIAVVLLIAGGFQAVTGIARENIIQARTVDRVGPAGGSLTGYTSAGLVLGFLLAGPLTRIVGADGALGTAAALLVVAAFIPAGIAAHRRHATSDAI
jgi:hypothetical protein